MSLDLERLVGEVRSIAALPEERDARLRRICDLLRESVAHYAWVGFYLVEPGTRMLALGPFAGKPTEHVCIPFGRGVCGQAAERGTTFVAQDVATEQNYLSCSASVRSEIVVPILKDGLVAGEIDIDSHEISPFTDADRDLLERVAEIVSRII